MLTPLNGARWSPDYMPQRLASLQVWLQRQCSLTDFEIAPASGDASFRRYFRLVFTDGHSLIAMDAPPDKEDCRPFVDVTRRLASTGVHVPTIEAVDLQQGFMLLEDLGSRLYLDALTEQTAEPLYGDAIAALLQFQQAGATDGLPPYDEALLRREMALFVDWLLGRHLGLPLSDAESSMLTAVFEQLVSNALQQPRVLVHRDYHSRNLLWLERDNPGIIDYQDAVSGPISYDLVSLLRDCYVSWPPDRVDGWLNGYAQAALQQGLLTDAQVDSLPVWFDLMGVQRHLKASGIFARLNHRDGKNGYLKDIPRTLGYIVEVGKRRQAIAPLAELIQTRVLPRLADC
jgi:N-acetylmuramate 1-kinase